MVNLPITSHRDPACFEPLRSTSELPLIKTISPYREWLSSQRRHWLLTTAVSAVIMLCVIVGLWFVTPQYRATALIMIQPRRTEVVKIDPVLSPLPADSDTVTSELSVLRSRDLLA